MAVYTDVSETELESFLGDYPAGRLLCSGWLEENTTVVPLRALAEALGLVVEWEQATAEARLRWPGGA